MRIALFVLLSVSMISCSGAVVLDRQAPATLQIEPGGFEEGTVERVIDGDTIEVRVESVVEGPGAGNAPPGRVYDVRLIGIDTPETVKPDSPVECFGVEASAAATALLEGSAVRLVDDVENVDGYGRLLRYVYLEGEMANARLVANGYASAYTYPPNVRHADLFVELQREARENDRGLWSSDTCSGES